MKRLLLSAAAPMISVLFFILPVSAAQAQNAGEPAGWERNIDVTKPVLNASVYDGTLSIEVSDKGSGVKVIYVNGYEFTDIEDGKLEIRLSRFDAAYEFFTVSAMDEVGNMSAVYKVRNPYYEDPESEDDPEGLEELLPVDAGPTDPNEARATVTDVNETNEFFTITTDNGKIFYLIINRTEEEENVYFLTEISENDLLNVTSDTNETLPRNTAVEDSAIPSETRVPAEMQTANASTVNTDNSDREDTKVSDDKSDLKEKVDEIKQNPMAGYVLMGVVCVIVIAAAYYFKVVKKKQEGGFIENEDEEDSDDEYEDDTAEPEDDSRPASSKNGPLPELSEDDVTDSIEE